MTPLKIIYDQFGIIQNLQAYHISQTSFLVGIFLDDYYSKTALEDPRDYNLDFDVLSGPVFESKVKEN